MNIDPVYFPKIRIRRDEAGRPAWRFTRKSMGLFLLLIVLGTLIGSFHLNQASYVATAGLEIVHLTEKRERVRQDNAGLHKQIAKLEALSNVRARAQALGFREGESVVYLTIDNLPSETPDRETSAPALVEDMDADEPRSISSEVARCWEELTAQFESWMNTRP